MTNKLSYPSLRCVLEYLEANRRIYITARSPALQRFEKSIPIHLEHLMISDNIDLNDIEMEVYSDTEIEFKMREKKYLRPYPMHLTYEKAAEKMNEYYVGGRLNIYTDNFWFFKKEVENFPKFIVKTNELTVYNFLLNEILEYINPNSFPLKEMTIECYDDLNHPHIRSAKKLFIEIRDDQKNEYSTRINAIQNKNIEIEYETLEWTDVMGMIRYWMENGKETGTTILRKVFHGDSNDKIVTKLRNEFCEIMSELTGVNDQNLEGTPGFSIPLTTSSKILVYEWRKFGISNKEIVLKVVSSRADDNTMEMEH
ncbi:hypothetical protein CRE_09664 [Caenorhabditis remanei]|uniref:F-box associated domain-containing protein n=1 Tax=Caenorhabditis remanei TaxID=31234 RepID=E3MX43_CAERE|nr:hypothetical protein CRE_09664 [Caenorhabditis remanei]